MNTKEEAAAKSAEWRAANKSKVKASSKRYYQEHREKILSEMAAKRKDNPDIHKKYYQENREELLARSKRDREKDLEGARLKGRIKYHNNEDKSREKSRRYREKNRDKINEKQREQRAANPDKTKIFAKKYRMIHKDKINEKTKEWRANNKDHVLEYSKQYKIDNPWMITYENARARCRDKNKENYSSYGGKGIKLSMMPSDFKLLWFRDKAYDMEKPSISRKDHTKDYVYDNCCYEELKAHIKRDKHI